MHWLPRRHDVLVCVHSPNVIAAYQVGQMVGHLVDGKLVGPASLIWRVDLPESIYDAAFDAHDGGRVAAFCGKGILMQFGPLEVRQPPQRLTMQSVAHLVPGHAAGVEKDAGSSGSSSGARGRQQPADKGRLLQVDMLQRQRLARLPATPETPRAIPFPPRLRSRLRCRHRSCRSAASRALSIRPRQGDWVSLTGSRLWPRPAGQHRLIRAEERRDPFGPRLMLCNGSGRQAALRTGLADASISVADPA
jgi:hypothetical protein